MKNVLVIGMLLWGGGIYSQATLPPGEHVDSIYGKDGMDATRRSYPSIFYFSRVRLDRPVSAYSVYTPGLKVNGLFCKMEFAIEAKSKLAPRFRLGSVNYTDWREGKKPMYMRYIP